MELLRRQLGATSTCTRPGSDSSSKSLLASLVTTATVLLLLIYHPLQPVSAGQSASKPPKPLSPLQIAELRTLPNYIYMIGNKIWDADDLVNKIRDNSEDTNLQAIYQKHYGDIHMIAVQVSAIQESKSEPYTLSSLRPIQPKSAAIQPKSAAGASSSK